MPRLSVILPCFNPPDGWVETIAQGWQFIKNITPDAELIIVNDGSTKNFHFESVKQQMVDWGNVQLMSYTDNQGKGHALREGVKIASGNLFIYTDIDFPYTHTSFRKIYSALEEGAEVAMGVRSEDYYSHLPTARVRISKTLRWFIKRFLRIPTDDTQCGLKGFNSHGKEIFLQTSINRYLFDLEFVFLSAKSKLSIKTIEVELRPDIVLSKMNWKILLQEGTNFLKIFFKAI